jgi:uncharacterized protein YbbC (DUF1343 family)/CubicO group peptidase (beta-lactamase class C family)
MYPLQAVAPRNPADAVVHRFFPILLVLFLPSLSLGEPPVDRERLNRIDDVVQAAIDHGDLPGAVVLVSHRGQVVFRKAYGLRSRQPERTPMTPETVFDLASLTKPVATATSIMILVEQGKLRLGDRVAEHLPAFGANGKQAITIGQLLLHTSGLIADNAEEDYRDGRAKALERICRLAPTAEPGTRFTYSDVGYIVLGELVERLGGMPLDQFAQRHIFSPLQMNETGFRPSGKLKDRAAPTVHRAGRWLTGEVHDPRAFALGGVAGHAGLFSTADNLARFGNMVLGGGTLDGHRILSPLTVRLMTTPRPVPSGLRAYGWDVQTSYSSNRGELFSRGVSFGHTGFTGTSIWIDPGTETVVLFLSNRVHPDGKGNVTRLRGQVATLAAAALTRDKGRGARDEGNLLLPSPLVPRLSPLLTGLDVLVREQFQRLKGRRVGLVTNHSGLDRLGRSTIDLLHQAEGVTLVALFSPEHGLRGTVDAPVADDRDSRTGLPIYSLYGARRRPSEENLRGIDTLVYDIQDAGCRFYTYISTLGDVLEAAGAPRSKGMPPLRVVVLDRPNPIGGLAVEGPVLDPGRESFIAYHALPIRHGLTVGELAQVFNAERKLGADLQVVRMEGWHRGDFYDQSGLNWINPSPNLRSLEAALLYPGIGLLERTNVSVGRGTERPFEWFGAPWLDGQRLAAALAREDLPGMLFVPRRRTPSGSVHAGKDCGGVDIFVDDWTHFHPVRSGLAIAWVLHRLYPEAWQIERYDDLLRHRATWEGLKQGKPWQELEKGWQKDLERFGEVRRRYLLY